MRSLKANGTLTTGIREIVAEEADVIRRIFTDYAAGLSARSIAARQNVEGIRSPESSKSSGTWEPSTISGDAARGTGVLNNELYVGRLVWNRSASSRIQQPASGRHA